MRAAHCSYDMLGELRPWVTNSDGCGKRSFYGTEPIDLIDENINGIELPPNILLELRMLGYPLMAYNRGELEDAINACSVDKVLLENPEAHSFRDKLKSRIGKKSALNSTIHGPDPDESIHPIKKNGEDEILFAYN